MATSWHRVDDLDDPRLGPYRDLRLAAHTPWSGLFVVEGRTLVERLAASRFPLVSVLVSERYVDQLPANLPADTSVLVVGHRDVDQLIGFHFHRGMLACGQRLPDPDLAQLHHAAGSTSVWCICPRILDPTNLGSIIRNAAALGATAVIVGPQSADPFSRRTVRVSMGAALTLPIIRSSDMSQTLTWLRHSGAVELMATVLAPDAEPLDQVLRPPHLGLVFGSEGEGLPDIWISMCQRRITLPMDWHTDSLNVASATAVFLYHFTRVARHVASA